MKRFFSWMMLLLFLAATTGSMAQTPGPALPGIKKIHDRMAKQEKDIAAGVKGKMISNVEAKKYHAKLAVVRKKLAKFMRQNGRKKDLTLDQQKELLLELHKNNESIQGEDLEKAEEAAAEKADSVR